MTDRFFGQPIRVTTGGDVKQPETFWLNDQEHRVAQLLAMWSDYGFGKVKVKRPKWFMRHHRTYYYCNVLVRSADSVNHLQREGLDKTIPAMLCAPHLYRMR
ncbi:MAG: hypothetical protein EXR67_02700 [Dehalococcoidia bacterium]|nr:hypothetical protein [Dehalococcoidia bacterium]